MVDHGALAGIDPGLDRGLHTGHIAGHYLSGVSLMFAATGDARFKARGDYLVGELKAVQDAQGDGYIEDGIPHLEMLRR